MKCALSVSTIKTFVGYKIITLPKSEVYKVLSVLLCTLSSGILAIFICSPDQPGDRDREEPLARPINRIIFRILREKQQTGNSGFPGRREDDDFHDAGKNINYSKTIFISTFLSTLYHHLKKGTQPVPVQ